MTSYERDKPLAAVPWQQLVFFNNPAHVHQSALFHGPTSGLSSRTSSPAKTKAVIKMPSFDSSYVPSLSGQAKEAEQDNDDYLPIKERHNGFREARIQELSTKRDTLLMTRTRFKSAYEELVERHGAAESGKVRPRHKIHSRLLHSCNQCKK